MIDSGGQAPGAARARRPNLTFVTILAAVVFAISMVAVATATTSTLSIGSASNAKLSETLTVNAQGHTLYALSPETTSHLLCKTHECTQFWPPVTVKSRSTKLKDGAGVHGRLGILRRSNGMLQVTLRGKPLYRYSADTARGQVNGEGIKSFGGTWHAVPAAAAAVPAPSGESTGTTAPSSTPYEY